MIAPTNDVNTSLDDWFVWDEQRKSPPASRTKKTKTMVPHRRTSSHNKNKVVPEEEPVNQNSQNIQQTINQEKEEKRKQQLILNERIRLLLMDDDPMNKNHKEEHRHSHSHHQKKTKKHDHKQTKHHPKDSPSHSHHKTHHKSKKKRHSDHDASQTGGAAERSHRRRASDPPPNTHQHHQDEDTSSPVLAMSPNSISIRKKKLMAIPSSPRDSPRYWSNHGAGTEEQRQDFPASPSSKTKSPSFVHKQALHSQIKRNSRLALPVFPEHRHHNSPSSKKKLLGTSVRKRRNSAPSAPTKPKVTPSQKQRHRASAPAKLLPSSPDPPIERNKIDLRRDWSGELAVLKIEEHSATTKSSSNATSQQPPTQSTDGATSTSNSGLAADQYRTTDWMELTLPTKWTEGSSRNLVSVLANETETPLFRVVSKKAATSKDDEDDEDEEQTTVIQLRMIAEAKGDGSEAVAPLVAVLRPVQIPMEDSKLLKRFFQQQHKIPKKKHVAALEVYRPHPTYEGQQPLKKSSRFGSMGPGEECYWYPYATIYQRQGRYGWCAIRTQHQQPQWTIETYVAPNDVPPHKTYVRQDKTTAGEHEMVFSNVASGRRLWIWNPHTKTWKVGPNRNLVFAVAFAYHVITAQH